MTAAEPATAETPATPSESSLPFGLPAASDTAAAPSAPAPSDDAELLPKREEQQAVLASTEVKAEGAADAMEVDEVPAEVKVNGI